MSDKAQQQEMLKEDFATLDRVGEVPFNGLLPDYLVAYDLSVVRNGQSVKKE